MSLLQVANVTKVFGGLKAVNKVSLTVKPGKIAGLIGPNGSGKTTLFNLISGIYPLSGGSIHFKGNNVTGFPAHTVNRLGLARTFQEIQLFYDMTVLENAMLGCHRLTRAGALAAFIRRGWVAEEESFIRQKALSALEFVGLTGVAADLARKIPYGHQRLLEVARALAGDPTLLLLDEPAAGMNQAETQSLMKLIANIRKLGVTVFLVEHNMRMVMGTCDYITVLSYGRVIAQGSPNEVQKNEQVIHAYLGGGKLQC